MIIKHWILVLACIAGPGLAMLFGQQAQVQLDDNGVLRWSDSGDELYGFGVNYTAPFAHAYRSAERLGVDLKAAIDQDIYHFARLGFDAYRVHVWDTEISDSLGNVLENEHLQLFDYMLSEMEKRGMRVLLTPIAFWGNGWPEPDTWSPGFAHKYGKDSCLINADAIAAQENYLYQLLNHVNPYTSKAYKNDPNIVAFEISNEPHHQESTDSIRTYVTKMVTAMRRSGTEKPIFYNFAHSIHQLDAYIDGGAQGGTFQWYPTGLGAGEEIQGNLLVNVDDYKIPFANDPRFKKSAKVVYEFDAADVGRSYIYPAMARSFRTAGIQWATHFAYDPTFLAYANTEYNTHYMNLVYTPQKALALAIAGKVFHEVPRYANYGRYPQNTTFGDFSVSYEKDLAVYNGESAMIYTNHNEVQPKILKKLEHISGYGNGQLVQYDGTGAYFLDHLEKGVWRLEVMPDAIWVHDPFGKKNSLKRTLAEIVWSERNMSVTLPDLDEDFELLPVNAGNQYQSAVNEGKFAIKPGTYILRSKKAKKTIDPKGKHGVLQINEFGGIPATISQTYVLHEPIAAASADESLTIKLQIASDQPVSDAKLLTYMGWDAKELELEHVHGFDYVATLPAEYLKAGNLRYYVLLSQNGKTFNYPSATEGHPYDWDFEAEAYEVPVVGAEAPIYLYNARTDDEEVARGWIKNSGVIPAAKPGDGELQLNIMSLFTPDPENPNVDPVYDYTLRYCFKEKTENHAAFLVSKDTLVIAARSLEQAPTTIQVALISTDAMAYGAEVQLQAGEGAYKIALADLEAVPIVTMPRPYPSFLPYYFQREGAVDFDIQKIETLQISVGPGLTDEQMKQPKHLAINHIRLQ